MGVSQTLANAYPQWSHCLGTMITLLGFGQCKLYGLCDEGAVAEVPGPDSLWAFLIWLGDHGWREWRLITSFVVVAGAVIALISATSAHLITCLIALFR